MVLSEPSMRVVPNQSPMAGGRPTPGGSWLLWQVAAQKPDGGGGPGEIVAAANFRAIDGLSGHAPTIKACNQSSPSSSSSEPSWTASSKVV